MVIRISISWLFMFLLCSNVFTQEPVSDSLTVGKKFVVVKMQDKSTLNGELVSQNDSLLSINSSSLGIITFPSANVKSIDEVKFYRISKGNFWYENPSSNYYLVSPSAFPVGKREFYFRNTWVVMNTVGYGITDYFSLNAGFDFISLLVKDKKEGHHPNFMLFPQFSFSLSKYSRIATGFLFINGKYFSLDNNIGISLLNFTYGDKERNIGIGLGYDVLDPYVSLKRPVLFVNGICRVSNRIALEAELYRWPINEERRYIINYGVKFIARKMSVDFGFFQDTTLIDDYYIGIPILSFTFRV